MPPSVFKNDIQNMTKLSCDICSIPDQHNEDDCYVMHSSSFHPSATKDKASHGILPPTPLYTSKKCEIPK